MVESALLTMSCGQPAFIDAWANRGVIGATTRPNTSQVRAIASSKRRMAWGKFIDSIMEMPVQFAVASGDRQARLRVVTKPAWDAMARLPHGGSIVSVGKTPDILLLRYCTDF